MRKLEKKKTRRTIKKRKRSNSHNESKRKKNNDRLSVEAYIEIKSNRFPPEEFSSLKKNPTLQYLKLKCPLEVDKSFLDAFLNLSLASKEVNCGESVYGGKSIEDLQNSNNRLKVRRPISSDSLKKEQDRQNKKKRYKSATKLKLKEAQREEEKEEEEDIVVVEEEQGMLCENSYNSIQRSASNNGRRPYLTSETSFKNISQEKDNKYRSDVFLCDKKNRFGLERREGIRRKTKKKEFLGYNNKLSRLNESVEKKIKGKRSLFLDPNELTRIREKRKGLTGVNVGLRKRNFGSVLSVRKNEQVMEINKKRKKC